MDAALKRHLTYGCGGLACMCPEATYAPETFWFLIRFSPLVGTSLRWAGSVPYRLQLGI